MKLNGPKKCCFCFPLRKGLLGVGYIRLVICLLPLVEFTMMCVTMFKGMQDSYDDAVIFLKLVASIIAQLLDLIFTVNFIVAAHKKNLKLFEVYYLYCITMVLVYSLVVILAACDMKRFNVLYYMMFLYAWYIDGGYYVFIGLGVGVIFLQMYMTLLVRSEVHYLKERNKAELARQRSCTSFRLPKLDRGLQS